MPPRRLLLDKKRYGVGISWFEGRQEVDLDLQAVIVDDRGHIVDAVYYNNLSAMSGAIAHTGDLGHSVGTGGEMIWVSLSKLPSSVRLVIFVVAAYNKSRLADAIGGRIGVAAEYTGQNVAFYSIENSSADVDAVLVIERLQNNKWELCELVEKAQSGKHFLDILEPNLGDIIRQRVPSAPEMQRVFFQMEKNCVIDLPSEGLQRLCIHITGELRRLAQSVDMDVAAVFYSRKGKNLGAVYYDNDEQFGVTHLGNTTNDEDLSIDLATIPNKVGQIFIVMNVYTEGRTFADLRRAEVTVTDQDLHELASYLLEPSATETGLVVCRIYRSEQIWNFQAMGRFCHGPRWVDALPELSKLAMMTPKEVQQGQDEATPRKFNPRLSVEAAALPPAAAEVDVEEEELIPVKKGGRQTVIMTRIPSDEARLGAEEAGNPQSGGTLRARASMFVGGGNTALLEDTGVKTRSRKTVVVDEALLRMAREGLAEEDGPLAGLPAEPEHDESFGGLSIPIVDTDQLAIKEDEETDTSNACAPCSSKLICL